MTSRDFCYWLQGFFELTPPGALTEDQAAAIRRHLAMVFIHEIDPSMPDPKLDEAHSAGIVIPVGSSTTGVTTITKAEIEAILDQAVDKMKTQSQTIPAHTHSYQRPPLIRC